MYCKYCGKPISNRAKYCSRCGRKLSAEQPEQSGQAAQTCGAKISARTEAPGKIKWVIIGVAGGAAVAVILLLVFLGGGSLSLGGTQTLAMQTVAASGGTIKISETGTALDGLELSVPEGAYAQDIPFTISATEITSSRMGDLFCPVTPLISVENGGAFADEPMFMTIPIQLKDGEFAMAFGYDSASGELEGIPFQELENDHITILTAHFSGIVVSKADKTRISGDPDSSFLIDSGFKPGINDFQMPNMSDANNYGHCAGQCIAEMYYYSKKGRIGWDKPLYGRFDNDGLGDTPGFFWDDAKAIRLCAAGQKLFKESWTGYVNKTDEDTYYAFAYAIAQTRQPQLCLIHTEGAGHAIIVYGVKGDALLVADPNFPGQTDRYISYLNKDLKSYFSGANSQEAGTENVEYTDFGYYGAWKLVNKEAAGKLWLAMSEGKDPGAGYFPPDISFQAVVGLNGDGSPVKAPLTDGMTVYAQDLASNAGNTALSISTDDFFSDTESNDTFVFYSGTTVLNTVKLERSAQVVNCTIPIKPGVNDLGIRVMRQGTKNAIVYDGFLNFYRFRVTLADGQPTATVTSASASPSLVVTPEETTATAGKAIPFAVFAQGLPANPVFVWDFGDDYPMETKIPAASHIYMDPGKYHGNVYLADASNPTLALAQAEFVITVFLPEGFSPPPSTHSASATQWTVLLENAGEVPDSKYLAIPAETPPDAGVTLSVTAPRAGRLRVTAQFASSMASGPRFYGDEMGYRAQAAMYLRPAAGEVTSGQFSNAYDKEYYTLVLETDAQAGQTVEIQIVPQSMTCYTETWTPASDGNGYMYVPGQYKLLAEFR